MNRIDRISAILIQLQSKRVVKAQDIAARFNISLRTVYRDIKSLDESGVPVIGEAGVGYSLMEGYRLPPVMFTREEAIAFLTAEKLVGKLTDESNGRNYSTAMMKIRSVLRTTEKDLLEQIEDHIEVMSSRLSKPAPEITNPLQKILKCITGKQVMTLKYFSNYSQEKSERTIEPVGVFHVDNYWHLIAYCRMRQDYRDFRFDRISSLEAGEELFTRQHEPLKNYLQDRYKENKLTPVTLRVKRNAYQYLTEQKYYMGFVSELIENSEVEMSFLTPSLEGFARWYMLFGDSATILTPDSLVDKVRAMISKIEASLKLKIKS